VTDKVERLRPRRPCPICKRPSTQKFHPFCSNRCAQIDLGRWVGGTYAIPGEDVNPGTDQSGDDEN
jgi:uncharacterized protein